jgi:hypothetical protein
MTSVESSILRNIDHADMYTYTVVYIILAVLYMVVAINVIVVRCF